MTEPTSIWQKIEYSALGDYLATSSWAFPTLETLHVIALVTVLGTIMVMDMRMVGWTSKNTALTLVAKDTLKLTWIGFVLAAITGTLLFISKASSYMINPWFLAKLGLLALAGLNMLYFHFVVWKNVDQWDTAADIPGKVKLAGYMSLFFWVAIVFVGRAIGFTLSFFY